MDQREDELKQKLQDLQKQLGKKQMFEEAVASIRSLLHQFYPSASPSLRKSFFTVISRVATILKTRYTSPGFWSAGQGLFLEAEQLVSETSEREHLRTCIARAREQLSEIDNQPEESAQNRRSQGYLFEGHLTVDQEPPQPQWLVQSNLMAALAASMAQAEPSRENPSDGSNNLPEELMDRIRELMPDVSEESNLPQEMIDRLVAMVICSPPLFDSFRDLYFTHFPKPGVFMETTALLFGVEVRIAYNTSCPRAEQHGSIQWPMPTRGFFIRENIYFLEGCRCNVPLCARIFPKSKRMAEV